MMESTLARLLEAWQDGGLTEGEEAELLRGLSDDPELRRNFAEQVVMLGALRAAAEPHPRWLALFDLLEQPSGSAGAVDSASFEAATMGRIARTNSWYKSRVSLALAAAVALLAAGPFWLKPKWVNEPSKPSAASVGPSAPSIPAIAVVVGASSEVEQTIGTYLKPGTISQATGWLTIETFTGVSVTLDAPFRAQLINSERVRLSEGRARVRVPEGAEGFTLDSPAFDVVDLGTEFAAQVKADGTGTCRVFEGVADVSLLDSTGEVRSTQRLHASQSVRVTPGKQDLKFIEEVDSDYPEIKRSSRPMLRLPPLYAVEVMRMRPLAFWRFERIKNQEVTNEVVGGLNLRVAGTASLAKEGGTNHSGALTQFKQLEFFRITGHVRTILDGDFSISLFTQFDWLQNFALFTATRFDEKIEGNSLILQSYSLPRKTGVNDTRLHVMLSDPPAWSGGTELTGATSLRSNYWHHIAATRKGDQLTLYLDGKPVGSETSGSMPLNYRDIFIGRLNGNPNQTRQQAHGLMGHIDELAIFSRALTDSEVRTLATPAQ